MANPPDHVVPADAATADAFARRLSADHRREIAATGGIGPVEAVRQSLAASVEAYAFRPAGSAFPIFMMGVEAKGALTASAMVWMLATDAVKRHKAGTLRAARWGLSQAFAVTGADSVTQYIPEWYGVGLAFAERLGFTREAAPQSGRDGGRLFHITLTKNRYLGVMKKRTSSWDI